jgi:DNA-binding CsgD family transcriptional regulator
MLQSREAILCAANPHNRAWVEWAMLPFSEDGETIDRAVILRNEMHRPSAEAPWMAPHAATLAEFANRHQIGIVTISRRGSVQFANAAATKMLSETDAFSFSYPGELIGHTAIATGLLQQGVPTKDTRRAVIDDIVLRSELYRAGLMLSLRQLNVLPELNSIANQIFGLRAAEARIATGIVHGKTLQKISHEAGITLNTARTQLKSAMGRMGVTRQQELVRLLCLVAAV